MKTILVVSLILGASLGLSACGIQKEVVQNTPPVVEQVVQTGSNQVSSWIVEQISTWVLADTGGTEHLSKNQWSGSEIYFQVNDIGIKFQVNSKIKDDLTYKYIGLKNGNWGTVLFSAKSLIDMDSECSVDNAPLGALSKLNGEPTDSIYDGRYQNGVLKQFDGFFLVFTNPQAPCTSNQKVLDHVSKLRNEIFLSDIENILSTADNESSNSIFSNSQIQDILAKIEENTKKQQEQEKNSTGVLIQGDYRAEYLPSKNHTDDTLKISMGNKELIYSFSYNLSNKKYCKPNEEECVHRSIFSNFIWFSPDKKFLTSRICGYEACGLTIIDLQNNKTFVLGEEKILSWIWTGRILAFYQSRGPVWELRVYDMSNSFKEPLLATPWEIEEMKGFYVDEKYFYGTLKIFNSKNDALYLKIYDLTTLKEVFSKEITK